MASNTQTRSMNSKSLSMASKVDELNEYFVNVGKKAFEKSQQGMGEDSNNEYLQTPTISHNVEFFSDRRPWMPPQ